MSTESRVADRSASPLERLYHKHSLATRVLHWANFIVIFVLLWTAFLLLSGTPELPYSHWLSPGFYAALHLDNRNDEGRVWHVLFSFLMIAIGVIYVAYLAGSGRWTTFVPNAASWKDAYLVVLNDLGVRRHTPSQTKYNGAQRIAYTGIVLLGLGEVVTGLPIYFKGWIGFANLLGGQDAIRAQHFAFMLGIIAFIIVHLVQVARAGWNNFRSMVTGIKIVPGERASGRGDAVTVEQAEPEPDLLSEPLPVSVVNGTVRAKSRGGALSAAIIAVAAAAFIDFAHQQSVARAGVPTWLDWARDTQDPAADADRAKSTGPNRGNAPADTDANGAPK